ncbi:MAG: DMT family transporter [candidate division KSB1 bacterium]|nr:DMT family transporter [candidate division KSB1 bacterium]
MGLETRERAILLTLVSSFLWGSSFVAVKVGLRYVDPIWFAFWRTLGAGTLLILLAGGQGRSWYFAQPRIWLLGGLNAAAFVAQNVGMLGTTASKAAFYVNLGFVGVAFLSWAVLGESFGSTKVLSISLGVVGVTGLATGFRAAALRGGSLWGDALVIAAGLLWAGYFVMTKLLLEHPQVRVVPLTGSVLALTGIFLLPLCLVHGHSHVDGPWQGLAVLTYTTVFCSAIPLVLWAKGLRHLTPTASAVILLAEPVIGAVFGFVLLGERFSPVEAGGALLILVAIGLYSKAEVGPDDR